MDERTNKYAETLQKLIRIDTVSDPDCGSSPEKFEELRTLLWELFPHIREACELKDFGGPLLLKWKGTDGSKAPVLFMNHHDVVPADPAGWKHPPFSGEIADGKIWGRGTLDDKGGLWAMLQAADELAAEGFVPSRDIWFETNCNEETRGEGSEEIANWLHDEGIRFEAVFDEGGDIVHEPISGADGTFAMIGVGEKSVVNLKFIAKSSGGHASTPGKNTPIVRLGRFMTYVERHNVFDVKLSPTIAELFRTLAPYMGSAGKLLAKPEKLRKPLELIVPKFGATAAALVSTTIAFTMTGGGEAVNVIPHEAWVIADMRCSHHQGQKASIEVIRKTAAKFGIETEVLAAEHESGLADYDGSAFRLAAEAAMAVVPGVDACAPYIMTGASDSRFFDMVSDQCIRFLPFTITAEQMDSIHGINECLDIDTLAPAVSYYRYMYTHL